MEPKTYDSLSSSLVVTARNLIQDAAFFQLRFQRARGPVWSQEAVLFLGWGRNPTILEVTRSPGANLHDVLALGKELDLYVARQDSFAGAILHTPLVWLTIHDDGGVHASSLITHLLNENVPVEILPAKQFAVYHGTKCLTTDSSAGTVACTLDAAIGQKGPCGKAYALTYPARSLPEGYPSQEDLHPLRRELPTLVAA